MLKLQNVTSHLYSIKMPYQRIGYKNKTYFLIKETYLYNRHLDFKILSLEDVASTF